MEMIKVYKASDGKIFYDENSEISRQKCMDYEASLSDELIGDGITMFNAFGRVTNKFRDAKYIYLKYINTNQSNNEAAVKVKEKFKQVYARVSNTISTYTYGFLIFDENKKDYVLMSDEWFSIYKRIFAELLGQ